MNILCLGLFLMQVQLAAASGTVTKPGGNEPLPKASVLLAPVAPGQIARLRSTVTEEDGRFEFRDIVPGDYRVTVDSDRYGQASYGQRKPGGPGAILTITAGQQLTDLRVSMIPTGTIAGRITGRNGEPFVNAVVQAFKYGYEDGKKTLITAQSTKTDDRGEYRLFWLPAGQYIVAAATSFTAVQATPAQTQRPGTTDSSAADFAATLAERQRLATMQIVELYSSGNTRLRILEDGTTQEEAWAPVYYPAALEARLATALDVAPGTTRNGIDIVIGPARVQSVRGRVVGIAPGSLATVSLVPQDLSGLRTPITDKGASTIDGSFTFTGVLPGDYVLLARRVGVLGPPVPVHVGEGDVDNLILAAGQTLRVTGRVVVESPTPLTGISITFRPTNPPLYIDAPAIFQDDPTTGSFVLPNVVPGDYQMQVSTRGGPPVKPLYVRSMRLGQTDLTEGIRISATTADRIEIVLTPDPGSVEGVAIGSRGGPAANATVVLVPNTARKRSDLYKSIVTAADGRFRFQNLTPGDYKLFAWDDVETGAWQDPDFIRNYESKGLLVRIAEKSKEDVQLNVIYNP